MVLLLLYAYITRDIYTHMCTHMCTHVYMRLNVRVGVCVCVVSWNRSTPIFHYCLCVVLRLHTREFVSVAVVVFFYFFFPLFY